MEVLKLHCPSCGAMVDVPDDIDTFYCSHCGTKLLVSGQDKDTLDAKVRLRIAEKKLDLEYADKELERKHKAEQEKRDDITIFIVMAMLFVMGIVIFNFMRHNPIFKFFYGL